MEKKKLILPIFIISILVLSTFGIVVSELGNEDENIYKYNDVRFIKKGNLWSFRYQDREYSLVYGPRDLEDVNLEVNLFQVMNANKIYVSVNPKENIGGAYLEMLNNLKKISGAQIVSACTEDVEGCERFPLKTCKDANDNEKVIIIKQSNKEGISYGSNCLVIEGDSLIQVRYVDKFILKAIGI